ncbi:MAG: glycosyltransferase family 4 protein [Sarcina sp.]
MKILVITQYFWPEEFRINDICDGLIDKGYEIDVITAIPNYPYGKFFEGYSKKENRVEIFKEKINVIRVNTTPRQNGFVNLVKNYLSYMFWGSIQAFKQRNKGYDKIFVFQLSPITIAIPGIIVSKLKKIPSTVYVQDVWPESLYAIKVINNKLIRSFCEKICSSIYKSFDNVLITSRGFKGILMKKGVIESRIKYFPQWAEDIYLEEQEIINKDIKKDEFLITFAGNIGKAQSVDTIIKAASYIKNKNFNLNIKWKLIGDGSEFNNMKALAEELNLETFVEFVGRKPVESMPMYFSKSDALVATLVDNEIFNVTLPAKVQSYMASNKPILVSMNGAGNDVVKEIKCGLACEAEDYISLAQNAIKLAKMSDEERNVFANNGKKYFEENFTREKLLNELDCFLRV